MIQLSSSTFRRLGRQLKTMARASEWWGYKLAPLLATAYATAVLTNNTLWSILPCLLILLLALMVGAVYVSLLNDWTDRAIDQAAGKTNRLSGQSPAFVRLAIGGCLLVGLGFGIYFWFIAPAVSLWYSGAWIAYSLYSLPPFRLKVHGFWGTLADTAGAHFFPQLFTVSLVSNWCTQSVSASWWWAIGIWALACGIRNMLWHQLSDVMADQQAGIRTFVISVGEQAARRLGQWVAFPVEALAFGRLLMLLAQPGPMIALALYAGVESMNRQLWGIRPRVLAPNQRIVLNDYYITYYPLALLLTQSAHYPPDSVVLLVHMGLFGHHVAGSFRNLYQIAGHLRHRLFG